MLVDEANIARHDARCVPLNDVPELDDHLPSEVHHPRYTGAVIVLCNIVYKIVGYVHGPLISLIDAAGDGLVFRENLIAFKLGTYDDIK